MNLQSLKEALAIQCVCRIGKMSQRIFKNLVGHSKLKRIAYSFPVAPFETCEICSIYVLPVKIHSRHIADIFFEWLKAALQPLSIYNIWHQTIYRIENLVAIAWNRPVNSLIIFFKTSPSPLVVMAIPIAN